MTGLGWRSRGVFAHCCFCRNFYLRRGRTIGRAGPLSHCFHRWPFRCTLAALTRAAVGKPMHWPCWSLTCCSILANVKWDSHVGCWNNRVAYCWVACKFSTKMVSLGKSWYVPKEPPPETSQVPVCALFRSRVVNIVDHAASSQGCFLHEQQISSYSLHRLSDGG